MPLSIGITRLIVTIIRERETIKDHYQPSTCSSQESNVSGCRLFI